MSPRSRVKAPRNSRHPGRQPREHQVVQKPVRGVVFDFYGTLAHPLPDDWWPTVRDLIAATGCMIDEEAIVEWASPPIEHLEHSASKQHYDAWSTARLIALLTRCGLEDPVRAELAHKIESARRSEVVRLVPGAHGVIDELRGRGLKVAVCSNWDWDLDRQIGGNALEERLDAVVCSARVGYRKPHERIFAAVFDALCLAPEELVFVGDDWDADMVGATNAGMSPVHAAWAYPCARPSHSDIACLSDLEGLLDLPALASP